MIIDCHGHYTTAPGELTEYRKRQIAALGDPKHVPAKGRLSITDDQIRESPEGAQLKLQRARHQSHHLLAAGDGHGTSSWKRNHQPPLVGALQRADPPGVHAISRQLRRRLPAAADARRASGELHRGPRALRAGVRFHRLQSESRSLGRTTGKTRRLPTGGGIRYMKKWSSSMSLRWSA